MKLFFSILGVQLFSSLALAVPSTVTCKAIDAFGQKSTVIVNARAGEISKLPEGETVWSVLFAENVKCGLPSKDEKCTKTITHNFDLADQPYYAVHFQEICMNLSANGKIVQEMSGEADLNRFDDKKRLFHLRQNVQQSAEAFKLRI